MHTALLARRKKSQTKKEGAEDSTVELKSEPEHGSSNFAMQPTTESGRSANSLDEQPYTWRVHSPPQKLKLLGRKPDGPTNAKIPKMLDLPSVPALPCLTRQRAHPANNHKAPFRPLQSPPVPLRVLLPSFPFLVPTSGNDVFCVSVPPPVPVLSAAAASPALLALAADFALDLDLPSPSWGGSQHGLA